MPDKRVRRQISPQTQQKSEKKIRTKKRPLAFSLFLLLFIGRRLVGLLHARTHTTASQFFLSLFSLFFMGKCVYKRGPSFVYQTSPDPSELTDRGIFPLSNFPFPPSPFYADITKKKIRIIIKKVFILLFWRFFEREKFKSINFVGKRGMAITVSENGKEISFFPSLHPRPF